MITVYVLSGETGTRYVGITNNLPRRLSEHHAHRSKGGQLLGAFSLALTEEYPDYATARRREIFLKSGQGRKWLDTNLIRPEPAEGGQGKP
jgi:putative endonuclease